MGLKHGGHGTWELFEFYRERRGEVLLWMELLRTKLVWHPIFAFLFVRIPFFVDENGLLAKPLWLRHLLYGPGVLAKRLHYH